jgi:hypothetical protein
MASPIVWRRRVATIRFPHGCDLPRAHCRRAHWPTSAYEPSGKSTSSPDPYRGTGSAPRVCNLYEPQRSNPK